MGKQYKQWQPLFFWAPKSLQMVIAAMKLKYTCSFEGKLWQHSIWKSRHITLSTKVHLVKAMVFPVSMWELDYKENWTLKNWCFWTVVLEKTLESPLDFKEIQPVHPKGNQPWILIGRTDVEAETLILWPPVTMNWLIWKDPDVGRDWRQEEKWMTDALTDSMDMSLSKSRELVMDREAWHAAVYGVPKSWTWQSYWTEYLFSI